MNAVCTLFEGHYHLGAGALINSLHSAGFTGRVLCGYRGDLPVWAEEARQLPGGIEVSFIEVKTDVHLTYYKPEFMLHCWDFHCPAASQLHYFDPDIVVKAPWTVFNRWAERGVALCEDVNAHLPARHPYRLQWVDFLERHGLKPVRSLDLYYNAGYVGVPQSLVGVVYTWAQIIEEARRSFGSLDTLKRDRPHALFHSADQDALNMALMTSHAPINGAGPESMDFQPGGHLLSHAIGGAKPWRGGFLRAALRGHPPGTAQKSFFRFAEQPLRLLPAGELARLRLSLHMAAMVGRIYRRA